MGNSYLGVGETLEGSNTKLQLRKERVKHWKKKEEKLASCAVDKFLTLLSDNQGATDFPINLEKKNIWAQEFGKKETREVELKEKNSLKGVFNCHALIGEIRDLSTSWV